VLPPPLLPPPPLLATAPPLQQQLLPLHLGATAGILGALGVAMLHLRPHLLLLPPVAWEGPTMVERVGMVAGGAGLTAGASKLQRMAG